MPLYIRKDDKKDVLLNLEEREEKLGKRFVAIHKDGDEILNLVKVNHQISVD